MTPTGKRVVKTEINGVARELLVEAHWTLLRVLRDELEMIGTREGCGEGSCGSCTVLVDGRPVRACLLLAVRVEGCRVVTIEGLSNGNGLHPIQQAFVEHGASQCGFCTPGMILSAKALLDENPTPTDGEIREFMSGNLCRCGSYSMILNAIRSAGERVRASRTDR